MLTLETRTGPPIAALGTHLVPVARSLRLSWGRGGLIWNRAIGIRVTGGDGETWMPIPDRTRRIQLTILLAGLLGGLVLRRARGRRRPQEISR